MSGAFVDIARVRIESAIESLRIYDIKEVEVTTTKDTEAVAVMNQRRVARGWTRKMKAVEGTIKVPMSTEAEVDWDRYLEDDIEFNLYLTRHTGSKKGKTRQIVGAIVDEITEGYAADGSPTYDVHFMALDNVAGK